MAPSNVKGRSAPVSVSDCIFAERGLNEKCLRIRGVSASEREVGREAQR